MKGRVTGDQHKSSSHLFINTTDIMLGILHLLSLSKRLVTLQSFTQKDAEAGTV